MTTPPLPAWFGSRGGDKAGATLQAGGYDLVIASHGYRQSRLSPVTVIASHGYRQSRLSPVTVIAGRG
jgi:hypothetical protein